MSARDPLAIGLGALACGVGLGGCVITATSAGVRAAQHVDLARYGEALSDASLPLLAGAFAGIAIGAFFGWRKSAALENVSQRGVIAVLSAVGALLVAFILSLIVDYLFGLWGVAGLAAAELIAVLAGAPLRFVPVERVSEPAVGARWAGPEMIIASAATAVIGLYLLLTALIPGKSSHMVLRTDDRDLVVGLSRRGLCRIAESAAQETDGVTGARARIRGRTVRIVVHAPEHAAPGLRARVENGVRERVLELGPARLVQVRAKVRSVKGGLR